MDILTWKMPSIALLGLLFLMIISLSPSHLRGDCLETVTLHGRIQDAMSNSPIPVAMVCGQNLCGNCWFEPWLCSDCTATDSTGFFSMKVECTIQENWPFAGSFTLDITAPKYEGRSETRVVFPWSVPCYGGVDLNLSVDFGVILLEPLIPPTSALRWGPDTQLTNDSLSDSAPVAAIFENEMHLVWNHTYDGEMRHGVIRSDGLHDLGFIADCPTGSGAGLVVFRDSLYSFYPQGEYPVNHLFGQIISAPSAQFQLTSGNVYDAYGAAAVVYRDTLYCFWKRWVPSGDRNILYETYDGEKWSQEITIAIDGYCNARPAVVVYKDELYLFYSGGGLYKKFDGNSWGLEQTVTTAADASITPGVTVFRGQLYDFYIQNGKIVYRQYDGVKWSSATAVPATPPDEIRDIACTFDQDSLYLFWGSYYSWSRSEIFAKSATIPHCGDVDGDGSITIADVVFLINYIFTGGSAPQPLSLGDVDCSGSINIADCVYLINYVFSHGAAPCALSSNDPSEANR